MSENDIIEIVPDEMYMTFDETYDDRKANADNFVRFVDDKSLVYTAFFADFGPLDLGLTYKFCSQLNEAAKRAKDTGRRVIYVSSMHPHKRSNNAVLICAYMVFVLNYSVEQAYAPFMGMDDPFIPYRDAGFCINTFPITVLDCVKAMYKARIMNWFSFRAFSLTTFQNLAKLQNGDVSWIVPGKFIAFSGPVSKRRQVSPGVYTLIPEEYVPLMKGLGVSCIVRFNSKCYDRNVFLMNGIRHVDLLYEDGGNPTEAILQSFIQICENERGAIAVHCKAGLGRTGTNIVAYMMKHYGFTAREGTAWCRLCRPGSIVGPQQQYLCSIESRLMTEGRGVREKARNLLPFEAKNKKKSKKRQSFDGSNNINEDSSLAGDLIAATDTVAAAASVGVSIGAGEPTRSSTPPRHAGGGDQQPQQQQERVFTPTKKAQHIKSGENKHMSQSLNSSLAVALSDSHHNSNSNSNSMTSGNNSLNVNNTQRQSLSASLKMQASEWNAARSTHCTPRNSGSNAAGAAGLTSTGPLPSTSATDTGGHTKARRPSIELVPRATANARRPLSATRANNNGASSNSSSSGAGGGSDIHMVEKDGVATMAVNNRKNENGAKFTIDSGPPASSVVQYTQQQRHQNQRQEQQQLYLNLQGRSRSGSDNSMPPVAGASNSSQQQKQSNGGGVNWKDAQMGDQAGYVAKQRQQQQQQLFLLQQQQQQQLSVLEGAASNLTLRPRTSSGSAGGVGGGISNSTSSNSAFFNGNGARVGNSRGSARPRSNAGTTNSNPSRSGAGISQKGLPTSGRYAAPSDQNGSYSSVSRPRTTNGVASTSGVSGVVGGGSNSGGRGTRLYGHQY